MSGTPSTGNEHTAVSEIVFEPRSAVNDAAKLALQGAGVGFVIASVQTALEKHNRGAMGVFTRGGGTIGFFAAVAATFAFTDTYVANIRHTHDPWNGAAAGCAAGLLAGARARSIPVGLASCAALATVIGTFDAAGGSLTGAPHSQEGVLTKEEKRRRFFKHGQAPVTATPLPNDSS